MPEVRINYAPETCALCGGSGGYRSHPCNACGGTGWAHALTE
jgi:DnaJ-class molecular chaperone